MPRLHWILLNPPRQFQSRNVRFHLVLVLFATDPEVHYWDFERGAWKTCHLGGLALQFTIETHQSLEISRAFYQGRSREYRTGKLNVTRCGCRSSRTTLANTSSVADRLSGRDLGAFRVRGAPIASMGHPRVPIKWQGTNRLSVLRTISS